MDDYDRYVDPFPDGTADPYEWGRRTYDLVSEACRDMSVVSTQVFTAEDGRRLTVEVLEQDGGLAGMKLTLGEESFYFKDRTDNTLLGYSELLHAFEPEY